MGKKREFFTCFYMMIFMLASFACALPLNAQNHVNQKYIKDLEQAVLRVHEKQKNIGLAAVVRRDGQVVFSKYAGYADIEHRVAAGPETRFGMASLTKLFTAVTLLRLNSKGLIDLDAPVQKYIAAFPEKSQGVITVLMLATHRSGIPHPQNRTPKLFATHYETATEALEIFINEELVATPGLKRVYSSSNYNLLAAIIERVTGKNFQEVVQEEILASLKLDMTAFDNILRPLANRSRRYRFYHPWTYAESSELYLVPTWDYSFNMGGGNLISNAGDVAKFGEALLAPGLLTPEQYELLYDPAWFGSMNGQRFIYWNGSNPGVQAGIAIYPQQKVVAVVLSNTWGVGSPSGEMVSLAKQLAEILVNK